ncbi:MAG: hypothetical protein HY902_00710, partial [Deltaproteobacteria bacterium]|nr:hypothetical protein [Deltaproteobacteria bacterium]
MKYMSVIQHLVGAAAAAALLASCGENVVTTGGTTVSDAKADQQVVDLPLAASVDQAAWQCPGGYGCPCDSDGACAASGLCVTGGSGSLGGGAPHCAVPCAEGYCAAGEVCRPLPGAKGGEWWCVASGGNLCDPCSKSEDCAAPGHSGARCVDYGSEGRFCGVACQGDADCGAGYHCGQATTVEGHTSMQCLKNGAKPEQLGVCECSSRAKAQKLETVCGKGNCQGKRSCGETGLSTCSAPAPASEVCNGQDDDCDGQTDESSCSDNNPCTTDSCDPAKGCSHGPADGAPCSDKNACTDGDLCDGGSCKAGAAVECGDSNPCTTESCDPVKGCQTKFADATVCDDGNPCTKDDACKDGSCKPGAQLICDDKNPCTADSCADGTCTSTPVNGAPCNDDSACTGADTCA